MVFVYPAIFHEEKGTYWVEFPDLPGCQTFGTALEETVEFAQEALAGYLITLLEDEREIPSSSDIKNINTGQDSFTSLVSCNIDQYRSSRAVKKTLTIPGWLNDMAVSRGINFSKVLQDALLSKVAKHSKV